MGELCIGLTVILDRSECMSCYIGSYPGGGGGHSSIKIPGCVCWGSENVPILKDTLGTKKNTHIEGFLCILHTHIMV